MVNYIWLKISAAVTVLCGMYTTYKVTQYLKLKNMRISDFSELENCKDKFVMAQGVVVPLEAREIASSIDKIIVYGSQGTRLQTNYVKHIVT